MLETPTTGVNSPRPAWRRWGWLVVLALLVLGSAGLLYALRPRVAREIARFPAGTGIFAYRQDGIVVTEAAGNTYACYAWNGTFRWRVTLPKPDLTGWPATTGESWLGWQVAASPDGRTLVAFIAQGPHAQVMTWQDGKVAGRLTLSHGKGKTIGAWPSPHIQVGLEVLDNGRVFLYFPHHPAGPLFIIEGSRLLASGDHLIRKAGYTPSRYWLAPDANVLVSEGKLASAPGNTVIYATLAISAGRMTATPRQVITTKPDVTMNAVYPGGIACWSDNACYGPRGKINGPTSRFVLRDLPYGRYLTSTQQFNIKVTDPLTKKSWSPQAPHYWGLAKNSANGNMLITDEWDVSPYSPALTRLCKQLARIPKVREILPPSYDKQVKRLAVYQQPGRLRVQIRIVDSSVLASNDEGNVYAALLPGGRFHFRRYFLSPDGHRIALVGKAGEHRPLQVLLLKW